LKVNNIEEKKDIEIKKEEKEELIKKLGGKEKKLELFTDRYKKECLIVKENINIKSYEAFIKPLRIKENKEKRIILYSRDAFWLNEHYYELIKNLLKEKKELIITSEI